MCSNKVSPRKHVVVIVDSDNYIATLLICVEDADIASLNAAPWQMRVKLRVLQTLKNRNMAELDK